MSRATHVSRIFLSKRPTVEGRHATSAHAVNRSLSIASSGSGTLQKQREQEGLSLPENEIQLVQQHKLKNRSPQYVKRNTKANDRATQQDKSHHANRTFKEEQAFLETSDQRRQELHSLPTGGFQEKDWRDAHNLIQYWCQERAIKGYHRVPSAALKQAIPWSLELLERLLQEQHLAASPNLLHYEMLKVIANGWREAFRRPSQQRIKEHLIQPREFLERVENLASQSQGLLRLHTRIYTSVMDASLRIGIQTTKAYRAPRQSSKGCAALIATKEMRETAEFVDSLMQRMHESSLIPDQFAYITAIKTWEWACDGDRARRTLQTLCNLYEQDNDKLPPTKKAFHAVLRAYARGPKSPDTIDQCYEVIQKMQAYHNQKGLDTMPDADAFNSLLTCLLHNPHLPNSVDQAETMFRTVIPTEFRDTSTFNIMLELYSKLGMDVKAVSLLMELIETYESTGDKRFSPQIKSFNLVLSACTKAGNHGAAEKQFRLMEELHANGILVGVSPDQVSYSILLDNWVKQVGRVPDACARADAILHTMKRLADEGNASVRPTAVTYTTVMHAYAKTADAIRAEELLNELTEQYSQRGTQDLQPDLPAFNTVLLALSRSNLQDAPERSRSLIQKMKDLSTGHGHNTQPDLRSYHSLMLAIAKSGTKDVGEQCERIMLETMVSNPRLTPNELSYLILVQAYTRADKAEHAERILEQAHDQYFQERVNSPKFKPSVKLFSAVMNAWAKRKTVEAPEKAEALLERMKALAVSGDLAGSIDTTVYNTLLDTWASSGRADAGERADAILQELLQNGLLPTTITYNIMLKANAALGKAARCEEILGEMGELPGIQPNCESLCTVLTAWSGAAQFEGGDNREEFMLRKLKELQDVSGIVANVACYNVILGCLSKSNKEESCRVAEELLQEMEHLGAQDGNWSDDIRPNNVSYTSVIHGYANMGNAEKAELILERMINEYARTNDNGLRPTTACINATLRGWAKKSKRETSPEAPARASALLNRMQQLHKTAALPVKPDVTSYNILMDVWGNSDRPNSATRAFEVLQRMMTSEDRDISPNTVSYNTCIAAYARHAEYEKAEWLLQSMYQAYSQKQALRDRAVAKPNLISWNSLLKAYSRSRSYEAAERAEIAIEEMQELHSKGILEARPDTVSFNCLMYTLAKSSHSKAGLRCEAILGDMESRFSAGDNSVKPDSHSFGAAIYAWLRQDNFEAAEALLNKMRSVDLKPSLETLGFLLGFSGERTIAAEEIRGLVLEYYPQTDKEGPTINQGGEEERNSLATIATGLNETKTTFDYEERAKYS